MDTTDIPLLSGEVARLVPGGLPRLELLHLGVPYAAVDLPEVTPAAVREATPRLLALAHEQASEVLEIKIKDVWGSAGRSAGLQNIGDTYSGADRYHARGTRAQWWKLYEVVAKAARESRGPDKALATRTLERLDAEVMRPFITPAMERAYRDTIRSWKGIPTARYKVADNWRELFSGLGFFGWGVLRPVEDTRASGGFTVLYGTRAHYEAFRARLAERAATTKGPTKAAAARALRDLDEMMRREFGAR